MPEFTKTEARIMKMLNDGKRHLPIDLVTCLPDKNGENKKNTLSVHICHIRKKINPIGEEIVCEYREKKIWYRKMRFCDNVD